MFETGLLEIRQADNDRFQLQFFSGAGALGEWKEKTLDEYDLGEDIYLDDETYSDENGDPYGVETNVIIYRKLTQQDPDNFDHLIFNCARFDPSNENYQFQHSICMYYVDVLRRIIEQSDYELDSDVFNDEMRSLLLFSDRRWDEFLFEATDYRVKKTTTVPKITPVKMVTEVAKIFCWSVLIDSQLQTIRINYMPDSLTKAPKNISDRITGQVNLSPASTDVKELSWELSTAEKNEHSAAKGWEGYRETDPVVDIANLPATAQRGEVKFVYDLCGYVLYDGEDDAQPTWKTEDVFQDLENLNLASSGKSLKAGAGTKYLLSGGSYLPVTRRAAVIESSAGDYIDLLFYRGLHSNGLGGSEKPLVTPYTFNAQGVSVGTRALRWRGDNGLYERSWKPWLDFLADQVIGNVPVLWTWSDFYNLDLTQPVTFYDEYSGSTTKWLIRETRFVVHNTKGILPSRADIIRID